MNTETVLSTDPVASSQPKRLDFFERYLSFWVFGCMIVGVTLGRLLPATESRRPRMAKPSIKNFNSSGFLHHCTVD